MRAEKYRHLMTKEYMMGPSGILMLDEMLDRYPLKDKLRILDLGCGTGLSSLFLAHETGAEVFAVDLWCSATDNLRRFVDWGVDRQIIPLHADALDLPFAEGYFDAVVSVDAYHYFACDPDYFTGKLLPLVKKGGTVLIIVPGAHEEFTDPVPPEILEWGGEDYRTFHSCEWWKETIGSDPAIASVECIELSCAEPAWDAWFASGHEYALRDQEYFGKGIGRYLNFVGIAVRKAEG